MTLEKSRMDRIEKLLVIMVDVWDGFVSQKVKKDLGVFKLRIKELVPLDTCLLVVRCKVLVSSSGHMFLAKD